MTTLSPKKTTLNLRAIAAEIVDGFSLDELKVLHNELVGGKGPGRKVDVADSIAKIITPTTLLASFNKLEQLDKLAIGEALYSSDGYVPDKFAAQYGGSPKLGYRSGYRSSPSLLRFFITYELGGSYRVRDCFKECLRTFVPQPPRVTIKTLEILPEYLELKTSWQNSVDAQNIKIVTAHRADAAQSELWAMLKAIQDGQLSVSEKTSQPSGDMMWKISRIINGDYYQTADNDDHEAIGFIRSFAWPMLLQTGGLTKKQGKKLITTNAAKSARSTKAHEVIASLWKSWLENDSFDEFRRIDSIKGQTGRGKKSFSSPISRKQAIVKTLVACPANAWIDFDEFSRFMRATGNFFKVTYDAWSLYITDPQYGSLGYDDRSKWETIEERYMLCFFLEYASTLGLLDVAFIDPSFGHNNYQSFWGIDELSFLSRYDGLLYFRINALGAFCLGQTSTYSETESAGKARLSVMPNLRICLTDGDLPVTDRLLLESFADSVSSDVWELSKEKSLLACESGQSIVEFRQLLNTLDDQDLPEKVETFLARIESNTNAVKADGTAVLFRCRDASVAAEIASHHLTKKICQLSGTEHLVVKSTHEDKFRKAVRIIGYGLD